MKRFVHGVVLGVVLMSPSYAQEYQRHEIESEILGETRVVQVLRPENYESRDRALPLLIALDGPWHQEHLDRTREALYFTGHPNVVIVAIEHPDRERDMTLSASEELPTGGNAGAFLGFLADELIPWAEEHLRAGPYRILFGHSIGGGFGVYSMVEKPDLFDAVVLATPNTHRDDFELVERFESVAKTGALDGVQLYVELANEIGIERDGVLEFRAAMDKRPNSNWRFFHRRDEGHNSMAPLTAYHGLKFVFRDFFVDSELTRQTPEVVEQHYAKLGRRLSYDPRIPQFALGHLVEERSQAGELEDALAFADYYVEHYPVSTRALFVRGEVLERMGRYCEAAAGLEGIAERFPEMIAERFPEVPDTIARLHRMAGSDCS